MSGEDGSSLAPADFARHPPPTSAGLFEVVTKLSSGDGTMTRRLSLTFSGVEIEGFVDGLIRRDEELRLVWLRWACS